MTAPLAVGEPHHCNITYETTLFSFLFVKLIPVYKLIWKQLVQCLSSPIHSWFIVGVEIKLMHVHPVSQWQRFMKQSHAYTRFYKFGAYALSGFVHTHTQFWSWIVSFMHLAPGVVHAVTLLCHGSLGHLKRTELSLMLLETHVCSTADQSKRLLWTFWTVVDSWTWL